MNATKEQEELSMRIGAAIRKHFNDQVEARVPKLRVTKNRISQMNIFHEIAALQTAYKLIGDMPVTVIRNAILGITDDE